MTFHLYVAEVTCATNLLGKDILKLEDTMKIIIYSLSREVVAQMTMILFILLLWNARITRLFYRISQKREAHIRFLLK